MKSITQYFIKNIDQLIELAPADIAFYGGSFFPPHSGHFAVAESALQEYVDYVVLCPHCHNPEKGQGAMLVAFNSTLELVALNIDASEFSHRLFVRSGPPDSNGIQNEKFVLLEKTLKENRINTFVLCGADAIKQDYCGHCSEKIRKEIRHIPHIIAPRGSRKIHGEVLLKPYRMLQRTDERLQYLLWKNVMGYCQAALDGDPVSKEIALGYFQQVLAEGAGDLESKQAIESIMDRFQRAVAGDSDSKQIIEGLIKGRYNEGFRDKTG